MDMKQFSFQGSVYAAVRDAQGNHGPFINIGDTDSFDISLAVSKDQQRETQSGKRLLKSEIITEQNANVSSVLQDFSTKSLGLGLYSTPVAIASGSASAELLPAGLAVGDIVGLQQQNISTLAIEDSLAAPLTLGTHYEIVSAAHGSIRILDLAAFTQPFNADYSYAGGINLAIFTQPAPERWIRVEGYNTADNEKPVLVDLYRVKFDPFETLPLINEAHGQLPLNGVVLYDPLKAGDADLGPFGRVIDLSQPSS